MTALMSIGEFALATGLSVKALRFYDDRALLAPVDVDPHSGYRRYAPSQVRAAVQIRVLRAAGLAVEDVKAVLEEPDRMPALLEEHAEALRRRRDLEDRALTLARAHAEGPDDGAPVVRERTAEAVAWVGVVMELHLDALDAGAANAGANDQFGALGEAAVAAGLQPAGPMWTAMRPGARSATTVEMVLALPVAGEVPPSFAAEGFETVTGVLPRRMERYAAFTAGEQDVDLLEDAPGGALPHPSMIALMEAFDDDAFADAELRQIMADPMEGRIELAATVRELEG